MCTHAHFSALSFFLSPLIKLHCRSCFYTVKQSIIIVIMVIIIITIMVITYNSSNEFWAEGRYIQLANTRRQIVVASSIFSTMGLVLHSCYGTVVFGAVSLSHSLSKCYVNKKNEKSTFVLKSWVGASTVYRQTLQMYCRRQILKAYIRTGKAVSSHPVNFSYHYRFAFQSNCRFSNHAAGL